MAQFDTNVLASIASGGNVINAQNLLTGVQRFKANELLLENAPAAEGRRVAQDTRLQGAEDRAQKGFEDLEGLRQGISLMRFLDKDDIQGAIGFVSQDGITEKEQRVIDMLQSGDPAQIEALKTGTKGLIETALLVGDIKGQGQDQTSDIQNFNFVKNLSTEDRALFMQAKRAGKIFMVAGVPHVMVGDQAVPVNTPQGAATLGAEIDAAGQLSFVKGERGEAGKQEAEIAAIKPKAEAVREEEAINVAPEKIERAESRIELAGLAIRDIDDAVDKIGFFTTGVTGWLAGIKPDTDRRDLDSLYETLRSRLGIEELGQMREQSKDGSSGFGQLNELELKGIQSARTALDANLSASQQIRNLNILRRHVLRQSAVAANIARISEGLLTEEQGQRQVRRDWLEIDLEAGYNDETGDFDAQAAGDLSGTSSEELRKAAGLD